MARLTALFYRLDHFDTVVQTLAREADLDAAASPAEVHSWVLDQFADLSETSSNIGLAGVFADHEGRMLGVRDILKLVAAFEEGRDSDFFRRHDHVDGYVNPIETPVSLQAAIDAAHGEATDLWYDEDGDIPDHAKDRFAPYTLVYFDPTEEAVGVYTAWLHEALEPALVKCLIDQPLGNVDPIALLEGEIQAELSVEEIEAGKAFDHFRTHTDHAGALVQVPGGSLLMAGHHRTVPQILADHLLRQAVKDYAARGATDLARRLAESKDPYEAFLALAQEKRPLILMESQYWEISDHVGRHIAEALGLDFAQASSFYDPYAGRYSGRDDKVLFYDDQIFGNDYEIDRNAVRLLIKDLVTSRDVGVICVSNPRAVPLAFQNYTDLQITLPAIVGPVRDAVFREILGPDALHAEDLESWTRYVLPFDFDKVLAAGYQGRAAVRELKERVDRRLSRHAPVSAPNLDQIHGLGDAKDLAEQLVGDIRAAVSGTIDWNEVDRGMLLCGPPGTGKTMLARAISKESGVRFIAGSALEWQASGALDTHLASIRNFFAEARRYAPTVVFIDEFDAIGNRQHHQGRNDYYTTAVVNCVLEELQGFHDREGVVVIAATNEENKIDPALKRAGRLDQTVRVRRPNVQALEKIYEYHLGLLKKKDQLADDLDYTELSRLTFGQTGADVEFYVRGARRRARKEARKVAQRDVVAEIMRRPIGASGLPRMTEEEVRRTAVHEAGHALVQLVGPEKGKDISFVSIIPRPDGSLGFVASFSEKVDVNKADILEQVRICLAGRAAEEVVYGAEDVGAGAGGSRASDLAQATRLLLRMYLQHGYSAAGGLVWQDLDAMEAGRKDIPEAVQNEVQRTLALEYRETVKRIRRHRKRLDKIVKTLLDRQEITGPELRDLMFGRQARGTLGRLFLG